MATEPIATVLSRRCLRCGALYPHDQAHSCPDGATAVTTELAAPAAEPAPFAATIEQQVADKITLPLSANPLPDTVQLPTSLRDPQATADGTSPAAPTPVRVGQSGPGSAPRPGAPVELVGLVLGDRYEIKERLSAGGMGVVYKARHIVLESPVAVKVLLRPQDSTAQRRFLQEAKVASAIRHPNTVYINDFGVLADGRSYLVMEFLQGPTLAKVLRNGPLEPVRACRIALQIAQGLQAVHARGIVHRDLKPDNIFLIDHSQRPGAPGPAGASGQETDFVKIVDFGIAVAARGSAALTVVDAPVVRRAGAGSGDTSSPEPATGSDEPAQLDLRERHTQAGTVLGTPHYMSPEQADNRPIDQSSDQYALGCILFEMLTGNVPYDHPSSATNILVQHLSAPIPSPRKVNPAAKIPEAIDALVVRMLAKKPELRYPSLAEVTAVLTGELAVMAPEEGSTPNSATSLGGRAFGRASITTKVVLRPRRWQLWAATGGVLALVLTVGYLGVQKWQQGRSSQPVIATQVVQELRGQALGELQQQLKAAAAPVRQQAVEGLGKARDVTQRASIEPLLVDADPAVQAQAADALGQLGDRAATPALKQLIARSSEASVRAAAAAALDVLGDEEGPRLLRQMRDGRDEQERFRAAYLLSEKGDRKAVAVLSEILERQAPPDDVAVDILARLAQAGEEPARKQLLIRLAAAEKLQRRLVIARRLAQIGDERGKQVLRELAEKPGPDQLLAARLLAAADELTGVPLFRRVLAERAASESEQKLAIEGLGLGGQLVDLLLLRSRLRPPASEGLRRDAATAVLQLAAAAPGVMSEQSLAWAQGALRDGNWLVRQSAAAVLGDAPGGQATQLLLPVLKDPEARVRRGAVKGLGRRPASREVLAALRVMLFDPDSGVREETLQSILRVGRSLQKQGARELPTEIAGWLKEMIAAAAPREQLLVRSTLYKLGDESQRPALQTFQSSADRELRRLWVREQEADVAALVQALGDDDKLVQQLAAQRLAERGDGRGVARLREDLSHGGTSALVAYGLLRKLGQPAELPPDVGELFSSPNVEARMEAVESLGKLPAEAAVPLLLEATHDPERLVRRLVAEIAADLPRPAAPNAEPAGIAVLRQLQQDRDASVRFRATVLLLRFGSLPPATALKKEVPRDKPRPLREPPSEPPPDGAPSAPVDGGSPDAAPSSAPPGDASASRAGLLVTPEGATFQLDGKAWLVAGRQPLMVSAGVHRLESLGGRQELTVTPGQTLNVHLAESPIEKLAHSGLDAFARKDYATALPQMDKAARDCAKKRKYDLLCAALLTELPLRIGQIYEQRGDVSEAMAEYDKADRAGHKVKGRPELLALVQKSRGQLAQKLGAVVLPKGSGGGCREVTTWLEPGGPYTFTVDGKSQIVNLHAGETIKLGECH